MHVLHFGALTHSLTQSINNVPPLRKHQPGQESDGQTGSWCLDKGATARRAVPKESMPRKPAHTST